MCIYSPNHFFHRQPCLGSVRSSLLIFTVKSKTSLINLKYFIPFFPKMFLVSYFTLMLMMHFENFVQDLNFTFLMACFADKALICWKDFFLPWFVFGPLTSITGACLFLHSLFCCADWQFYPFVMSHVPDYWSYPEVLMTVEGFLLPYTVKYIIQHGWL